MHPLPLKSEDGPPARVFSTQPSHHLQAALPLPPSIPLSLHPPIHERRPAFGSGSGRRPARLPRCAAAVLTSSHSAVTLLTPRLRSSPQQQQAGQRRRRQGSRAAAAAGECAAGRRCCEEEAPRQHYTGIPEERAEGRKQGMEGGEGMERGKELVNKTGWGGGKSRQATGGPDNNRGMSGGWAGLGGVPAQGRWIQHSTRKRDRELSPGQRSCCRAGAECRRVGWRCEGASA